MLSSVSRMPISSAPMVSTAASAGSESEGAAASELTDEQQKQVAELKTRDREVRAHERAHASAGGGYASAPSLELAKGPDGNSYAVSGEVKIDTSPEKTPEATIAKMNVVIAAALAPAEPSAADRAVAANAKQMLAAASAEAREKKVLEQSGDTQAGGEPAGNAPPGETQNGNQSVAIGAYEEANRLPGAATHSFASDGKTLPGSLFSISA